MRLTRLSPILAVAALLLATGTPATERSDVPDTYKWDLTSLYRDESAWVAAKQELVADVARLGQWQGKLGGSAGNLLAAMTDLENATQKGDRVCWYAYQLNHQDTRVNRSLQMKEDVAKVYTDLDTAAYARYRASPVKADRDAVFRAFWARYGEFTGTLASTLNAHVQSHVFTKDVRSFPNSLEAALFEFNIPTSVYARPIDDVHANLPTLHRYMKLRRKIMGLPEVGYEDLYAPIVATVDLEYTPEEAMAMTLDAFAPLGKEYVETLRKGYASRWADFLPNAGKHPGAYSIKIYDAHPYQLLNFNGACNDVTALAHESGHSMHSHLAGAGRPWATADYSTFVAEVASTLNETLLFHHMLERTKDDHARLFLLSSYLDTMRAKLFRQTMFAEFELRIHEAVERGEPLTGESLSQLYLELLRTYYGHDEALVKIDDAYAVEWTFVPHFYRDFYVYQYATSLIGGMSLAEGIIGKDAVKSKRATRNRDAYLRMLSAGSSQYPMELLKGAGVDMSTSQPFDAAIREMSRIMDEMERIYARQEG